jgi:hypothetical protein
MRRPHFIRAQNTKDSSVFGSVPVDEIEMKSKVKM